MSPIQKATEAYINDLNALRGMIEPLMLLTELLGEKFDEDHLNALVEHGKEKETEGPTRSFTIPPEHLQKVRQLGQKNEQYRTARKLLPRNFLVSFVSTYDAFLGNLIQALLEAKPEVINSSGKQLTYKELVAFSSIDAARTYVVESEVESLLRKSHSEQFDWMEKTFDIKLREGLDSWPIFIELTERRNLFVHCHGKASVQYLKICAEHHADITGVSLGTTLDAKLKYLVNSYKCLYEIGVKLSQVLWRKLKPGELEAADSALNSISFELLVLEKYELANRLLNFATKLPRHSSEVDKRIMLINLSQSYKFLNMQDKCLNTLNKMDWSACSDNFGLCVAILKDNFQEATKLMHRIGKDGAIKQHEYMDWPIFKDFRKSTDFTATYTEIFGIEPSELLNHSATENDNDQTKLVQSETSEE